MPIKKKNTAHIALALTNVSLLHITHWNILAREKWSHRRIACQIRKCQHFMGDKQYSLYPFPVWKWQTPHCFLSVCSGTLQTSRSREWAVSRGKSGSILGQHSKCLQNKITCHCSLFRRKMISGNSQYSVSNMFSSFIYSEINLGQWLWLKYTSLKKIIKYVSTISLYHNFYQQTFIELWTYVWTLCTKAFNTWLRLLGDLYSWWEDDLKDNLIIRQSVQRAKAG